MLDCREPLILGAGQSRRIPLLTPNPPISCCATGSPPIPPIRTSRPTSKALPRSRRRTSQPRSSSARPRRARRGARCTSSAAPMPPVSRCRMRSPLFARRPTRAAPRPWPNSARGLRADRALQKTKRKARKLLERAAEAGNPRAIAALAAIVGRRHAVRSGESTRAARERRRQQSGSAISARPDAGERRRRAAGRRRRARVV